MTTTNEQGTGLFGPEVDAGRIDPGQGKRIVERCRWFEDETLGPIGLDRQRYVLTEQVRGPPTSGGDHRRGIVAVGGRVDAGNPAVLDTEIRDGLAGPKADPSSAGRRLEGDRQRVGIHPAGIPILDCADEIRHLEGGIAILDRRRFPKRHWKPDPGKSLGAIAGVGFPIRCDEFESWSPGKPKRLGSVELFEKRGGMGGHRRVICVKQCRRDKTGRKSRRLAGDLFAFDDHDVVIRSKAVGDGTADNAATDDDDTG